MVRSLKLLSLFVTPGKTRSARLYAGLSDDSSLCHEKRYLNLGYWANAPQRLDEAGDDMARLVADAAGLSGGMEVLDVGFGFADQDILWMREYQPATIHGVNSSRLQVDLARERVAACGLASRIVLREGDATRLRYPEDSFDAVVSMEAAFHFCSREGFLREAHRVLRPGGILAMTDLCAAAGPMEWPARLQAWVGRSFWQIPAQNMYDGREYERRLRAAGFGEPKVGSIWQDVYPRFIDFARARLRDPELRQRMNPVFRGFLSLSANARKRVRPTLMDYVLVQARKRSGGLDLPDAHRGRQD
ncbi:MAG TPA: class I SAM-dependent methyltransferase [Burkholderiales bacterium]|nr:class I SAM-dependent methyltransferase [Burkholderiales bacterium]